jgi:hypothetical protein
MPLGEGFSEWEHLQSLLISFQNKIVNQEFKDVGNDSWDENISTPRSSLRVACTLKDSDTANMTLLKIILFYIILRKAQDLHPAMYAVPIGDYQETVVFKPQIKLVFREKRIDALENDRHPLRAEMCFRLIDTTANTITQSEVNQLALKIKQEFATPNPYIYRKGSLKCSYRDESKAYRLILYSFDKQTAKDMILKILKIRNDTVNWDFFTFSESEKNYKTISGTEIILGKSVRKIRLRPEGYVKFVRAELKLHGLTQDILLVSDVDELDRKAIEIF